MPYFRLASSALCAVTILGLLALYTEQSAAQNRARPVHHVTRAEAAMLLLKKSGRKIPTRLSDGEYPDVVDGEPYSHYVINAVELGMWDPEVSSNRLRPHKPITRAEWLKMLSIAFGLPRFLDHNYKDISTMPLVKPYAGIAKAYRLFYDVKNPLRLRAELPVTHEEAANSLYSLYKKRPALRPKERVSVKQVLTTAALSNSDATEDKSVLTSYSTMSSRQDIRDSLQSSYKNEAVSYAEKIEAQVIRLVNLERARAGIAPLKANSTLRTAAQKHAKDMAKRKYFSHFTPDGKSFVDRIKLSGYTDVDPIACGCKQILFAEEAKATAQEIGPSYAKYSADACKCSPKFALGENLAKGQYTTAEVVQDWMNSEGHRRNLLQPAYEEIGVAIFNEYWVQKFGSFELVLPN